MILRLHFSISRASSRKRPKLPIFPLTQCHQAFFGRPFSRVPSLCFNIHRLTPFCTILRVVYAVDFVKMSKQYQIVTHQMRFSSSKCTKFVFGRDSAADPAWGAYDAPRPISRSAGEGDTHPHSSPLRRLRRFDLGAFGASILARLSFVYK